MLMIWLAVISIALIGQLTLSPVFFLFNVKNKQAVLALGVVHLALCGYLLVPAAYTSWREYLTWPFIIFGLFQSLIGPAIITFYQVLTKKKIVPNAFIILAVLYMLFDYGVYVYGGLSNIPKGDFSYISDAFGTIFIQAPCLLLTVYYAFQDLRADLRNNSRRARVILLVEVSLAFTFVILTYLMLLAQDWFNGTFFQHERYDWRYDIYYGVLAAFAATHALLVCPFLLTRRGQIIFDDWQVEDETQPSDKADPASVDLAQLKKLVDLMADQRVYTNHLLSIGALAEMMETAPRQLRFLINKGLGWRNFNQFLNSYRLADAQAQLADPAQSDVPISAIALQFGFGSAQSFNRVFKAEIGMTPSEFREQQLRTFASMTQRERVLAPSQGDATPDRQIRTAAAGYRADQ